MPSTFIGNIEARIDQKGRVFIPVAYRKLLPDGERERIVMRKDPDADCLVLYPESVWNAKVETLRDNLDEWNPEDRLLLAQFVADAEWLDIDSQGRILINRRYLQLIGISTDVLFVGMLDKIAVWSKTNYEAAKLAPNEFAKLLASKMMKHKE